MPSLDLPRAVQLAHAGRQLAQFGHLGRTVWQKAELVDASGGAITTISEGGKQYRLHRFATSGTFTVSKGGRIRYLIVGGGGSGGANLGGGGSGGIVRHGEIYLEPGSYSIVTGVGVAAGNGGLSSAFGVTAAGGGRGAVQAGIGTIGAGNGSNNVTPSTSPNADGFYGGAGSGGGINREAAGGGAGAGQSGQAGAMTLIAGKGGDGALDYITGAAVYYGGGGGGSAFAATANQPGTGGLGGLGGGGSGSVSPSYPIAGENGLNGFGGGGGGGSRGQGAGGRGGNGVVLIRYEVIP